MPNNNKLFILAAEPSADLHGAHLIDALRSFEPSLSIFGIAGPRMREKKIHSCGRMEDFQVMGFTDVVAALPRLLRRFRQIRKTILDINPAAVVCIDYPEFNIRLERSLRRHGYHGKLIHYICPTVWAWGKRRIPIMAQNLDLLLTIFPFEKQCFKHTSLEVQYVGHPLIKKIASYQPSIDFYDRYQLDKTKRLLAIFPGSRTTEIQRNFPLQLQAAAFLQKKFPDLEIAISLAHEQHRHLLTSPFSIIEPAHHYDLMKHAYLAIATSGTVTLELALFQVPTVAHYAIKPFDVFLAQKIFRINLPHYVIVNILMNQTVFPELFGPHLTLSSLIHHAEIFLKDQETRQKCDSACSELKKLLGRSDASQEAAKIIRNCLKIK